jgi:hypothetical protein
MNVRVPVADVTDVAFEVAEVHGVEADLRKVRKLTWKEWKVQDYTYNGDK